MFKEARRVAAIKSGVFAEIAAARKQAEASGLSVIDLGIGSPDLAPPPHVVECLRDELYVRENYDYGSSTGLTEFREAVAAWYATRFSVDLDPESEVLTLMGSHDGLAHISMVLMNPGETALIPSPHYPVYQVGAMLAEALISPLPLRQENDWRPDFSKIPAALADRSKIMVLNYPNNPTAGVADRGFFEEAVAFALRHEILLIHDAAYSELTQDGLTAPSVMEIPGAKETAVEFHSVSKTYNIAGCRLGFVVGNARVIAMLARLKSNLDYGVFKAIQRAGIAALLGPQDIIKKNVKTYQDRKDVFRQGAAKVGWNIATSRATMFLWARTPGKMSSMEFTDRLIREAGVVVVPGNAFGEFGEGFVRIAMVTSTDRLRTAAERIRESGLLFV